MNNKGFSLIELIVIIAIMGVLVGGASLGIGLVFSKDAMKCATRLNDSIYDARANSMYKAGKFELSIDNTGSANTATISQTDLTPATSDTVYLDGEDSSKKTTISAKFVTEAVPAGTALSFPVNLTFDKAKGNVYFDVDADGTYDDGIIVFEIEPLRGNRNRKAKVQLVTTTGKHTIGEFK